MSNYEFNEVENQTVDELRSVLRQIGILFALEAIVQIPFFFLRLDYLSSGRAAIWLITILFLLIMSFAYFRPLDNLKRIVMTQGSDIKEMMQALADLRVAFSIAAIVLVLHIVATNIDSVLILLP
ncbi:MAG: hypothetical protein AAF614_37570 [Chloroflexota bacterium]